LWRDSVSDLKLDVTPATSKLIIVWEAMESLELRHAEPAVLPMERAYVRTWLALKSRGGTLRIKLEEKGPVP
jgi:hypothetical protein